MTHIKLHTTHMIWTTVQKNIKEDLANWKEMKTVDRKISLTMASRNDRKFIDFSRILTPVEFDYFVQNTTFVKMFEGLIFDIDSEKQHLHINDNAEKSMDLLMLMTNKENLIKCQEVLTNQTREDYVPNNLIDKSDDYKIIKMLVAGLYAVPEVSDLDVWFKDPSLLSEDDINMSDASVGQAIEVAIDPLLERIAFEDLAPFDIQVLCYTTYMVGFIQDINKIALRTVDLQAFHKRLELLSTLSKEDLKWFMSLMQDRTEFFQRFITTKFEALEKQK